MLSIPESPLTEDPYKDHQTGYFKSLTDSQTLDRRAKHKINADVPKTAGIPSPISPRPVRLTNPMTRSVPDIQEPIKKQKKPRTFNKIAILSSYFEQKIAQLSASGSSRMKKSWKLLGPKKAAR